MMAANFESAILEAKPRQLRLSKKHGVGLGFVLLVVLLMRPVMYPWAFFLGGDFHPLGIWRGWGRMHSKTAGDYLLYVEISPTTYKYAYHEWGLTGTARLCTPKGEYFALRLNGDMPRKFYVNSLGQPVRLGMDNWRATMIVGPETRPVFSLWGTWAEGEVRADDHKTLSQAFFPDGTLRPRGSYASPSQTEDIQVTLREGGYFAFKAACSAE